MKKSIFILFITITFLTIFSFNAFADFVIITWNQAKSSQLKGWRIYYSICRDGEVPDPPVSPIDYDDYIELEAFDAAGTPQTPMSQFDLPQGLKVYPEPGSEETYWEAAYRLFLPSFPQNDNRRYYLTLTAYYFNGNEGTMSSVINVNTSCLDMPEEPIADDDLPFE